MNFRGINYAMRDWNDIRKLECDLELHKELHIYYQLVTKLAIICLKRNIKLIMENPYSTQHYLYRYWCLKPKVIDYDRRERGDWFEKPTQYWFINREPSNNFIFEAQIIKPKKDVIYSSKVDRSMISKEYANRFIREFII